MDLVALGDPTTLDRVTAVLLAGRAVVLPTDTVYGLATLPPHQDELLRLKGRPAAVPIAVLVADLAQAESATSAPLTPLGTRLAAAFWPGPLTIVLPTAAGETLGVRCPDDDFVRAVAAAVGPVATTSANRHGEPTSPDAATAAASLAGEVAVVVDGGPRSGDPSTVVDATGTEVVILREGRIGSTEIAAAIH